MDFLVKIGETGLGFPYTNIPPNEKFYSEFLTCVFISLDRISYLQAKIKTDTRIEVKDQVLITKKGYRLQPNETFLDLEKENQFTGTINSNENLAKSNFVRLLTIISV